MVLGWGCGVPGLWDMGGERFRLNENGDIIELVPGFNCGILGVFINWQYQRFLILGKYEARSVVESGRLNLKLSSSYCMEGH